MKASFLNSSALVLAAAFTLSACSPESATVAPAEPAAGSSALSLETVAERAGYSVGVNIGMGLQSQEMADEISVDALVAGIRDTLAGEQQLSEEEMMMAVQELTASLEEKYMASMEEEAEAQRQFLVDNAENEGVMTTPSGLQYMVLEEGSAEGLSPAETDTVNVHYHGTLIDGTVFDSSVDRGEPISFPLNGVIAGWTEGPQLMSVGDKYRFFIPSDLAYGQSGAGQLIGPNATLIFDVELLDIE